MTLYALRLGALDMAIANLLGSNLFNIAILALVIVGWIFRFFWCMNAHKHLPGVARRLYPEPSRIYSLSVI